MDVRLTGTTILFTKGNEYLINTLKESLIIAFALVGLVVLILFRSIRAVFFALLPNARYPAAYGRHYGLLRHSA